MMTLLAAVEYGDLDTVRSYFGDVPPHELDVKMLVDLQELAYDTALDLEAYPERQAAVGAVCTYLEELYESVDRAHQEFLASFRQAYDEARELIAEQCIMEDLYGCTDPRSADSWHNAQPFDVMDVGLVNRYQDYYGQADPWMLHEG